MGERTCKGCELMKRRDSGTAPLWDSIYRGAHWDVVHAFNTSLPGWLVLALNRHLEALADLTEDEGVELGKLLRRVSVALTEITGCAKTYVMQFAELPDYPHVHFHVVPRMADQPEETRSTGVFAYLGVPEAKRVSEEEMNRIAEDVRSRLEG